MQSTNQIKKPRPELIFWSALIVIILAVIIKLLLT